MAVVISATNRSSAWAMLADRTGERCTRNAPAIADQLENECYRISPTGILYRAMWCDVECTIASLEHGPSLNECRPYHQIRVCPECSAQIDPHARLSFTSEITMGCETGDRTYHNECARECGAVECNGCGELIWSLYAMHPHGVGNYHRECVYMAPAPVEAAPIDLSSAPASPTIAPFDPPLSRCVDCDCTCSNPLTSPDDCVRCYDCYMIQWDHETAAWVAEYPMLIAPDTTIGGVWHHLLVASPRIAPAIFYGAWCECIRMLVALWRGDLYDARDSAQTDIDLGLDGLRLTDAMIAIALAEAQILTLRCIDRMLARIINACPSNPAWLRALA